VKNALLCLNSKTWFKEISNSPLTEGHYYFPKRQGFPKLRFLKVTKNYNFRAIRGRRKERGWVRWIFLEQ